MCYGSIPRSQSWHTNTSMPHSIAAVSFLEAPSAANAEAASAVDLLSACQQLSPFPAILPV